MRRVLFRVPSEIPAHGSLPFAGERREQRMTLEWRRKHVIGD